MIFLVSPVSKNLDMPKKIEGEIKIETLTPVKKVHIPLEMRDATTKQKSVYETTVPNQTVHSGRMCAGGL